MKRVLALIVIVTFGLGGCRDNKPTIAQKPNLSPEQKEITELIQTIQKETGVKGSTPRDVWETIREHGLFPGQGKSGYDEIIRDDLKWGLLALERAEKSLTKGDVEDARKEIRFAKEEMFAGFYRHLSSRNVEIDPEVKKLLRQYWEIRKKLEGYEEKGVKPVHDREGEHAYQKAKELHDLYFTAGAISIGYGRLEETITYLEEAVKNVRAAEIVFDFEWTEKLKKIPSQ
ncbi:MAG: hypothetical protein HY434_02015 [Candidatus Liptonbacteria bacterium]|nr:hypothetical protein [Candidatus Liptonbacteria bacterium]